MKKNFLQVAAWLLAITMLAMCAIAGITTLAKYASAISSTNANSVDVAKWDIQVSDDGGATWQDLSAYSFSVDLFSTIFCEKMKAAETDVVAGMIAPGTYGSFDTALQFKNAGDVHAEINVVVEIDVAGLTTLPVVATTGGSPAGTVDLPIGATGITLADFGWAWPFNGVLAVDNAITVTDTGWGLAGGTIPAGMITVSLVAQQVD